MGFDEVFYSFKNLGSWVRRKAWPEGVYYVMRGTRLIEHWHDGYERPVMAMPITDALADDWEMIER